MEGKRRKISDAAESALWALSNGTCYAPGCPFPVVFEVRPGVYRKNVQIAHIYGVSPNGPRFTRGMSEGERDSFRNLLLLCLPHHADVDDRVTGAKLHPVETLLEWKQKREGTDRPILATLGPIGETELGELLASAFEPPVKRLEAIAEQLERTGTLNKAALAELQRIVKVASDKTTPFDQRSISVLSHAADVFGSNQFRLSVANLIEAAEKIRRYSPER